MLAHYNPRALQQRNDLDSALESCHLQAALEILSIEAFTPTLEQAKHIIATGDLKLIGKLLEKVGVSGELIACALLTHQHEVLRLLLKHPSFKPEMLHRTYALNPPHGSKWLTPLQYCAANNLEESLTILLEYDKEPDYRYHHDDNTALYFALRYDASESLVTKLLEGGADANAVCHALHTNQARHLMHRNIGNLSEQHYTCHLLHIARHPEHIALLIKHKAHTECKDSLFKGTALHALAHALMTQAKPTEYTRYAACFGLLAASMSEGDLKHACAYAGTSKPVTALEMIIGLPRFDCRLPGKSLTLSEELKKLWPLPPPQAQGMRAGT